MPSRSARAAANSSGTGRGGRGVDVDRHQLPAVGRGGVLDLAAHWAGPDASLTLDNVHRFADPDYAKLSLAMRSAENPEAVFDLLAQRGQIVVHSDETARTAALADDAAATGALVVADTREQVADLNQAIRERLVTAGQVGDSRVLVTDGGERIGVGDRVATRRNDYDLGVANRDTWIVTGVRDDGTVHLVGTAGTRELPLRHAVLNIELAYASTAYGAQGETTRTAHLALGEHTGAASAYVAMTRGRRPILRTSSPRISRTPDSSAPSRSPATAPTSAPRMPPDSPPKRQPSTSPMLNRGTSIITTTRHLSLAGGPSPFQPSRAVPGPARASVSEPRQSAGVCVQRGPSLVDERRERLLPSRQINRQRQPGQLAVDLVVLVDDEVPVGDGQCPFDAVGGEHVEPRQPVRGLAELHHQRVPCLLQEVITEVGVLAARDDPASTGKPALDVQHFLGGLAIHHSSTASRRMSSSIFGFRPPYEIRSISRPRTFSISCLNLMNSNDDVPGGASTRRSMSES